MLAEFGKMIGRWIAFVLGKSVLRKFSVELAHRAIPFDLGDNAGGGDAQAPRISADEGGVGTWEIRHRQSIDEGMGRVGFEGEESLAHRPVSGVQDIPSVDLAVV